MKMRWPATLMRYGKSLIFTNMKDILRYGIDEGFIAFFIFKHKDEELGLGGRVYTQTPLRVRVDGDEGTLTIINEHEVHWVYPLDQKTMTTYGKMVDGEEESENAGLRWKEYNRVLAEQMKEINNLISS